MKPKIYFVSGVCGVGKTTTISHLKRLLPSAEYDVRDFDEFGVPDGADGKWRIAELQKWLEIGTKAIRESKSTIVCGFVKPKDLVDSVCDAQSQLILLDADKETIRTRLVGRYTKNGVFDDELKVIGRPVNDFIESNIYYCNIMRKECAEAGCKIIDTSNLTPEEVSKKIVTLIDFE